MPPALSDYEDFFSDSDSESITEKDIVTRDIPKKQSITEPLASELPLPKPSLQKKAVRQKSRQDPEKASSAKTPKKRIRKKLLADLDPGNILEDDENLSVGIDQNPKSSAPPSTYKTRASTSYRASQSNRIKYNQKYHPMDDVIRPSRSAKMKAAYGEKQEQSGSEDVEFQVQRSSESECEVLETKRQKVSRLPTRRSQRPRNHNVLYNEKIHPQDSHIFLSDSQEITAASHQNIQPATAVGSEDNTNIEDNADHSSIFDLEHDDAQMNGINKDVVGPDDESQNIQAIVGNVLREIPDSDEKYFSMEDDLHSLPAQISSTSDRYNPQPVSPLSDITNRIHPSASYEPMPSSPLTSRSRRSKRFQSPFEILMEPITTQSETQASASDPLPYEHNDKENDRNFQPQLNERDPIENTITDENVEVYQTSEEAGGHPSDVPSVFDDRSNGGHDQAPVEHLVFSRPLHHASRTDIEGSLRTPRGPLTQFR